MTRSTARRTAVLSTVLWLLAGTSQAAIVDAQAYRTAEGDLALSWTETRGAAVDVFMAEDPQAALEQMRAVSLADGDGAHLISPAPAAARSYFILRSADGTRYRLAERIVPLEGAMNFRDVGGYETADGRFVRWGKIYRSAALSGLTPDDLAKIAKLDIRYVYDLRSVDERRSEPTRWPQTGARLVSHDYEMDISAFMAAFAEGPSAEKAREAMTAFYPAVVDSHKVQFREIFAELLQGGDGAVLYHCSAGKDRTGVQTALILSALGVPRETVIEDFLLSNQHHRLAADMSALAGMPAEVVAVLSGVERPYIEAFFAEVDRRYGGVEGYLAAELGVDADGIARLRALYTE
ncbi:tyrosine-protein phosphatase [Phenylobacterium sp.]|uniref:tyrosine-protein phosphatase n=1 Tax=Phenylobacterium sp. TaxID=1871053 RepID=UPI002FD88DB3